MTLAEGWTFTLDQVRGMIAELEREIEQRRQHYPERVRKGDMLEADADYRIGIIAEIRADMNVAFHAKPWTVPTGLNLVDPQFPWAAKVKELERMIAQRERHYPDKIRKGELLEADAKAQLAALGQVHRLYHRLLFGYETHAPRGTSEAHDEIRSIILDQQEQAA